MITKLANEIEIWKFRYNIANQNEMCTCGHRLRFHKRRGKQGCRRGCEANACYAIRVMA